MRKAAGILMIIYGVKGIGTYVGPIFLEGWGAFRWRYIDIAYWLSYVIPVVFIIIGGVFCLKGKYWKLCFASSLCLSVFMFFDALPTFYLLQPLDMPYLGVQLILLPWGIIPIIFVLLRKSEWSESQA